MISFFLKNKNTKNCVSALSSLLFFTSHANSFNHNIQTQEYLLINSPPTNKHYITFFQTDKCIRTHRKPFLEQTNSLPITQHFLTLPLERVKEALFRIFSRGWKEGFAHYVRQNSGVVSLSWESRARWLIFVARCDSPSSDIHCFNGRHFWQGWQVFRKFPRFGYQLFRKRNLSFVFDCHNFFTGE